MKFSRIGYCRKELMGIAMILIVFFHTTFYNSTIINNIRDYCDFGVNIFYFLSGYSMYFSWKNDPKIKSFYKKRYLKLLVVFFPVLFVISFTMMISGQIDLVQFVLKITTLNFWITGNLMYWFISGLILLYFITPPFIMVLNKYMIPTIFSIGFICVMLIILDFSKINSLINIFLFRFPVYFFGIIVAKNQKILDEKKINKYIVFCANILIFSLLAIANRGSYLLYIFITIPIILVMSFVFYTYNKSVFVKLISMAGIITLEMYLFQERIITIIHKVIIRFIDNDLYAVWISNFFGIIVAIIVSIFWMKITNKICKKVLSTNSCDAG